jgi:hypothetical protein
MSVIIENVSNISVNVTFANVGEGIPIKLDMNTIEPTKKVKLLTKDITGGCAIMYVWSDHEILWSGPIPVGTKYPITIDYTSVAYQGENLPSRFTTLPSKRENFAFVPNIWPPSFKSGYDKIIIIGILAIIAFYFVLRK